MIKELRLSRFFISICLNLFFCLIYAQSNIKSGNIRSCDVWGNTGGNLQNINIINNTTIQSNATTSTISSMTLAGANSVLELNGTDAVSFVAGGSTNKSLCAAYSTVTKSPNPTNFADFTGTNSLLFDTLELSPIPASYTTDQTFILKYNASFALTSPYNCSNPSTTITAKAFYMQVYVYKNGVYYYTGGSGDACTGGGISFDGNSHTTVFGDVVSSELFQNNQINVTGKAGDVFSLEIRMNPSIYSTCAPGTNSGFRYCDSGSMPQSNILYKTKVEILQSATF